MPKSRSQDFNLLPSFVDTSICVGLNFGLDFVGPKMVVVSASLLFVDPVALLRGLVCLVVAVKAVVVRVSLLCSFAFDVHVLPSAVFMMLTLCLLMMLWRFRFIF